MRKSLFITFIMINILALMTLPGCRKKAKEITGTWSITTTVRGETSIATYNFVGSSKEGSVQWEGDALGNYSVDGGSVSFTLQYVDEDDGNFTVEEYNGTFDGQDFMNGAFTRTVEDPNEENPITTSGNWYGGRGT